MPAQTTLLQIKNKLSNPLSTLPLRESLPNTNWTEDMDKSHTFGQSIMKAQEIICVFFLDLVKQESPDLVLQEFEHLFINRVGKSVNLYPQKALHQIILFKDESVFRNTLKRCCYILVNNWISARSYKHTQDLIKLFYKAEHPHRISPFNIKYLKIWVANFIESKDYEELKLFVTKYENLDRSHWKCRYTSYLLASQYANSTNSIEQRQAARVLAKQLQEQFTLDLAMYTARSQSATFTDRNAENPTALGDKALHLVKKIVAKRGLFSYTSLAKIFLNQTQHLCYKDFKQSLLKYLIFFEENKGLVETLKTKIGENLDLLYQEDHEEQLNNHLLLKTCHRVTEYLTTEKYGEPSPWFVLLASQGSPLTLAVMLVKIILICPQSRIHLEVCLAKLIEYYEDSSQDQCQWVINFLEVLKIILTIYTENIQYNLVNMENDDVNAQSMKPKIYRVFSQSKY